MSHKILAAALAASLMIASGAAMAQGTPPVGDPTAKSAETPQQKVDNGERPTTTTTTQTTGSGSSSPTGGVAPSGGANK